MELLSRVINAIIELHPWHSPMVHFPIALTGAAFLFIVLARAQRNAGLEYAAFLLITLAAITTALAGLTGLRDNIVRFDGAAPLIPAKIGLAVLLLILTGATAISRWRRKEIAWRPATTALYMIAFGLSFFLALTLGFLGGVIIYGI